MTVFVNTNNGRPILSGITKESIGGDIICGISLSVHDKLNFSYFLVMFKRLLHQTGIIKRFQLSQAPCMAVVKQSAFRHYFTKNDAIVEGSKC